MEIISAEQAAEAAKGLTFEKVWLAMMETRMRMEETYRQTQQEIEKSQQRMEESQKESQRITDKILADLSRNIGGLGNSLRLLTETLFSTDIWKKFNELGYTFSRQSPNTKFIENDRAIAEVDYLLENGDYAMPVEVKTVLKTAHVNDHLERIARIRKYLDARGDRRRLIGAVAGGSVTEDVLEYAQKNGLFVIVQTGDNVMIADMPEGFKAREWY